MQGFLNHPFRVAVRALWLAAELAGIAAGFLFRVQFRRDISPLHARALWMQMASRRLLRIFNVDIRAVGPIPGTGLLVSNHLSYIDVLVLSALTPAIFIAKREVRNWPVFGQLARMGGTLFADRERRTQTGPLARSLGAVLDAGALVVLFPEGTSSDGRTILPFKSALLEPATRSVHPLSVSHIEYRIGDGDAGEEVCYWKDMTFGPHLLNLLSKRQIEASVRFSELRHGSSDRKELARQLHSAAVQLKETPLRTPVPEAA